MMKRFISIILCICLITLLVLPTKVVKAQTLRDYKNKVAQLELQKAESDALSAEAKAKIDAKASAIRRANNTIAANEEKVEDSKEKVVESKEEIKKKTDDLQIVIANLQYTGANTESVYLDYVFDAESISDLIEREAIIERITEDTKEQLEGLEKLIKENEELQVKLEDDNVELTNSIGEYEKQLKELQEYVDKQASIGMSYADQIKAQQNLVKIYENAGCKDDEDIDICYYGKLGGSGAFSRPLNSGRVTQAWNPTHGGMDLGGNKEGTPVYAPASGTVIYVAYRSSCGGNIVYMHCLVDGKKYTVEMAHLLSIAVKSGQVVQKGQVIGYVGGLSTSKALSGGYDSCSFGAHLHYAISYGYYFSESGRSQWSTFKSNTKATSVQSISGFKSSAGWKWYSR